MQTRKATSGVQSHTSILQVTSFLHVSRPCVRQLHCTAIPAPHGHKTLMWDTWCCSAAAASHISKLCVGQHSPHVNFVRDNVVCGIAARAVRQGVHAVNHTTVMVAAENERSESAAMWLACGHAGRQCMRLSGHLHGLNSSCHTDAS